MYVLPAVDMLDGNVVRGIGLDSGLVDIKVCAVDDTWSGLKFLLIPHFC